MNTPSNTPNNAPIRANRARWREWFSHAPIAAKLSVLGGAAVATVVVVLSILLGISQYVIAKSEFDSALQRQTKLLAETLQAAVLFGDAAAAREQLAPVVSDANIHAVQVLRQTEKLAEFARPQTGSTGSASLAGWQKFLESMELESFALQHASVPILADGKEIGTIRVTASFASKLQLLMQGYLVLCIASTLAILLAIWLMRRLAAFVTAPLVHLRDVMTSVQRDRSYDLRAEVEADDEVGALARVFNNMLAQVQTTDVMLRRELETRKETESRFQHLAMHDPLTGLPNRANMRLHLENAILGSRRSARSCALLFIDLDDFKYINDTYGHAQGDAALCIVSSRISEVVRGSDIVARLGGDEFAVLLLDVQSDAAALGVARKIAQSLQQPLRLAEAAAYVGCSVGVRLIDQSAPDADMLLSQADAAMYSAKSQGKGQAVLFAPAMEQLAREHASVAQRLRLAIDEKRLTVHFQPQYSIDGKRLLGFEALARWPGGPGPAEFIPVAEGSGLILQLSDYIDELALDYLQLWLSKGLAPVRLALNVSAKQLYSEDFAAKLLQRITSRAIDPAMIEVELTESIFLHDLDRAVQTLSALRGHGIQVAIDDFGTGYSALNYLKVLPASNVKLDRSFIQELSINRKNRDLVQAVIDMARALSLEVTAEGVETEQERQLLAQMGCHRVQGYLLGKPAPMEAQFGLAQIKDTSNEKMQIEKSTNGSSQYSWDIQGKSGRKTA